MKPPVERLPVLRAGSAELGRVGGEGQRSDQVERRIGGAALARHRAGDLCGNGFEQGNVERHAGPGLREMKGGTAEENAKPGHPATIARRPGIGCPALASYWRQLALGLNGPSLSSFTR